MRNPFGIIKRKYDPVTSTFKLVKLRIKAHLDGNGYACAELDAAGKDRLAHPYYFDILEGFSEWSNEELQKLLERESRLEKRKPICHKNGSLSFWSIDRQIWVEKTYYVSPEELSLMNEKDRRRVRRHLSKPFGF